MNISKIIWSVKIQLYHFWENDIIEWKHDLNENTYPTQIADLVEDMKKLDASSLEHLAAIVKEMVGNK